ncbi:hypothetical protein B0J13DRAFT_660955 [Dactylonectria estremocensis]|uniref:Knr4/Smi1-like domain-containing protein n=1 Tax=Dactylonectria estremocensis TaxID=1079267 RepID=A0A9P9EYH8_9HYPO|nr:hypothetical protein B0J13DRAFT_660955 [Dactylonectria estremocensis]
MSSFKKFDADAVLTDRSLPNVYRWLFELAQEFAVLGCIETAKTMISLLLSEYASDWQRQRIRFLNLAFAEASQWPEEIPTEEKTEEALDEIEPQAHPRAFKAATNSADDSAMLDMLLQCAVGEDATTGGAAMERSSALADASVIAVRIASEHSSAIEKIETHSKVQEVLGHISKRLAANQQIQYLTERRSIWPLFSTGALARSIPVDTVKVNNLAKDAIETYTQRFKNELLLEMEKNTIASIKSHPEELGEEVPESIFVLPPATDDEISALERKLETKLPADYKEFLKVSNGFGRTWNGYYLDSALDGVDDIDWAEMITDNAIIQLHEPPNGVFDLQFAIDEWPCYKKALQLGSEDVFEFWILPPQETARAIGAYKKALESPEVLEDKRIETMKITDSKYGSWEAFEKLDSSYGTFTKFLQEKVKISAMGCWEGEGQIEQACFSYSCKPDDN